MSHDSDSIFMRIAIDYAWNFQILTLPNPAVATLVLWKNTIIALQAHKKAGTPHAEVLACKEAFLYLIENDKKSKKLVIKTIKKQKDKLVSLKSIKEHIKNTQDANELHEIIKKYHSNVFKQCVFFITLGPCNHYGKTPPCINLLNAIKPKRIVIANKDKTLKSNSNIKLKSNISTKKGILKNEAETIIFPFTQWQKNNGFTIFKIAHHLNGNHKGGFISNENSRIFTHNMRCIADYIIISGETLRNDNPLLDVRFASGFYKNNKQNKYPKILIISRTLQKNDLSQYNIRNREVEIIDCMSKIPKHGLKIIEGGFSFLNSVIHNISTLKENQIDCVEIDCIMGYISPTLSNWHESYYFNNDLNNFYLAHSINLNNFWDNQIKKNHKCSSYKKNNSNTNMLYYLFTKNNK